MDRSRIRLNAKGLELVAARATNTFITTKTILKELVKGMTLEESISKAAEVYAKLFEYKVRFNRVLASDSKGGRRYATCRYYAT